MRRVVSFLIVSFIALASATPAFAQQRLFGLGTEELFEFDTRVASLDRIVRRIPIPEGLRSASLLGGARRAVPLAGGAHLAWLAGQSRGIVLADTRTGALRLFTFPTFLPTGIVGTDGHRLLVAGLGGSPTLPQLLVADVRTGALRFIDLGPDVISEQLAYAPTSDLLFIARWKLFSPLTDVVPVDVLHVGTERIVETLSVPLSTALAIDVNATGTRLFVTSVDGLNVFDTIARAIVATDPGRFGGAIIDEARNRLLAVGSDGLEALSIDTLQLLGGTSVPKLRIPQPPGSTFAALHASVDVSPLSATIFVFESSRHERPFECRQVNLAAVQADTGAVRRFVNLMAQGIQDCFVNLIRITESLPPTGLTATAAGRRVTMAWNAPVGAARYEVEAGLAPGQAALVLPTNDTQLVVDNAPQGVYYVRVRAINTIGKSAPSQEVQLIVQ